MKDKLPTKECISQGDTCLYHKQQLAACYQMKFGNLCSACKNWHTKDFDCKKKN